MHRLGVLLSAMSSLVVIVTTRSTTTRSSGITSTSFSSSSSSSSTTSMLHIVSSSTIGTILTTIATTKGLSLTGRHSKRTVRKIFQMWGFFGVLTRLYPYMGLGRVERASGDIETH